MKTLKDIANALNISMTKASKIKKQIELNKFANVPNFMIWGTGNKKKYDLNLFKEYL